MREASVSLAVILLTFVLTQPGSAVEREFRECPDCVAMVGIPGGSFMMGSPASEKGRFESEGPIHRVTLRPFALGKYDVSSAEFLAFLKASGYQPAPCNPTLGLGWHSDGRGAASAPDPTEPLLWPATCLSWDDAEAYLRWLNDKVRGLASAAGSKDGPYRLPSEAEWEYAARGGTVTARWWGEAIGTNQANCNGCGSPWDGRLLAPVDSFGPNPFGLYGMLGNVWQWVADCWHDSYVGAPADGGAWITDARPKDMLVKNGDADRVCEKRVMRGGSWINLPVFIRAAARSRGDADGADFDYSSFAGFRVARTLP